MTDARNADAFFFDPEQQEFPTFIHRYIWGKGVILMPPEKSLQGADPALSPAFADFYRFLHDTYADMYQNPAVYFLDCDRITSQVPRGDSPLGDWRKALVAAQHKNQKERSRILGEMNNIHIPFDFIGRCLKHMVLQEGAYSVDKVAFEKEFLKKLTKTYARSREDLLALWHRMGIDITISGERAVFSSQLYPHMWEGLRRWQEAIQQHKKSSRGYLYTMALRCQDYRIFLPDYSFNVESAAYFMSGEIKEYLDKINALLHSLGLKELRKLDNTSIVALGCDYKNTHLLYFTMDNARRVLRVAMFRPGSPQMEAFVREVEKQPNADAIKAFCLKGLNRCRKCGCHPLPPSQLGCWMEVFGKRVNLCGGRFCYETGDYTEETFAIVKTLIEITVGILRVPTDDPEKRI